MSKESECVACPSRLSSEVGSTTCDLCAQGYYKDKPSSPPHECKMCVATLPGAICPNDDTALATIVLRRGRWRLSELSTEILVCAEADGFTPCVGGLHTGAALCANEHSGVLCEQCLQKGHYFDASVARCQMCPTISGLAGFLLVAGAGCAIVLAVAKLLLWRSPTLRRLVRRCYTMLCYGIT